MRRVLTGALALVLLATAGIAAADEPAKVESKMVEFKGGAGPIKGYLARPEGAGPFPAIVLVHEWWGLTDWVEQNARRLAGEGYVALAVDLYGGKKTDDPGEAHELMRALDHTEAVADLGGGIAYLHSLEVVARGKKVGVIGWCMGGGLARELAQASAAVGPTVIAYGSITTDDAQLAKLTDNPVLGLFGRDDRGIPPARVEQFAGALKAKGGRIDLNLYPEAGHGFMRAGANGHNARAAADAWERIDRFFAENLKGKE